MGIGTGFSTLFEVYDQKTGNWCLTYGEKPEETDQLRKKKCGF